MKVSQRIVFFQLFNWKYCCIVQKLLLCCDDQNPWKIPVKKFLFRGQLTRLQVFLSMILEYLFLWFYLKSTFLTLDLSLFSGKLLKVMRNVFYFMLKALSVLKICELLTQFFFFFFFFFCHLGNSLIRKLKLIQNLRCHRLRNKQLQQGVTLKLKTLF